ncbi:MAG TPA: hypothetical protein VFL34_02825, partial [Candidatus Sulfotelmatobacter sp.]|nr:hypothetical protein [Candidatus Sulfotelmatobacter sp.]
MRLVKIYVRTAVLASVALAGSACQTAQKPVSLLPPGKAPALKPAPTPAQVPEKAAAAPQVPATQEDPQPQKASGVESLPAPDPAATKSSDPVADLIARVEKEYREGLANHEAGRTEEAKQDFDNALNDLLSSNLDVRSDERLQKEFDRIVQGVNDLYPGGTPTDADAQQQKAEPAPIDETNGLTPTPDARVKAKAQADLKNTHSDLPLMMTDQVAGYITYFSGRGR